MNFFAQIGDTLRDLLRHRHTTAIGLIAGLGSTAATVGIVQNGIAQLSAVHGLPPHLQDSFTQAAAALGTLSTVALVLTSTGKSLISAPPGYEPSPSGGFEVVPFPISGATLNVVAQPTPPMPLENDLKKAA